MALIIRKRYTMTLPASILRPLAWKPLVLASAISAIFSTGAWAQTEDVKNLPSVVVTAARVEQPQTEALPHTTVITKEMIRERQATDVISLLRAEAGIEITQTGGVGMLSALYLRGAESRQNLILIDGVPVRDASTAGGTAMALEHLQPDQIERIEIVRGNVSSIYGSGAIGGVVQIFTKRGSGEPAASASVEVGSRGTTKVSGAVSGQSGDTRYMVSASRFDTNGFSAMNTKQFHNENPDRDGDRNVSVSAAISHEWSKGNEFGVRVYGHDAKFSTDGGGFGTQTQVDTGQSKQETFAVFSKNRLTANWLSTVTVSQTQIEREGLTIGGYYPGAWHYKGTSNLLQWNNEVMLSPNWMLTAGVEDGREKSDDYSSSAISRNTSSAYAGLNGKLDAHSLQMNVRYDHVGGSGSATTGYLGYGYALTPAWKLIASASSGFLAPTLSQLYMPASWGGNPNLKPERSRSAEAGVQYAMGSTLLRTTVFESRTRDQIQGESSYPYTLNNIAKASNNGVEMSAGSKIADIDVRASLTLQNPENDADGTTLLRRAKTIASLSLGKSFGPWRIGGDVQYVSQRRDRYTDPDTYATKYVDLAAYSVTNLNLRYKLNKEVSLYGRIENLFNREYQTVYGYNQAPRGYFAGIEWRQ